MRDWTALDTLWLGMFLLVFSGPVSIVLAKVWAALHGRSLERFEQWLRKLDSSR